MEKLFEKLISIGVDEDCLRWSSTRFFDKFIVFFGKSIKSILKNFWNITGNYSSESKLKF